MNKKSISTFVAAACVATAIAMPALPVLASLTSRPDEEESRAKLLAIGRALQLYREEHPPLPVAQRRDYRDAGLPPDMVFLTVPGHKWSLPNGWADMQVSRPLAEMADVNIHFRATYWRPEDYDKMGDLSTLFRDRGERLIVLADPNIDRNFYNPDIRIRRVMVLRLNGTVEIINYDATKPLDWARK